MFATEISESETNRTNASVFARAGRVINATVTETRPAWMRARFSLRGARSGLVMLFARAQIVSFATSRLAFSNRRDAEVADSERRSYIESARLRTACVHVGN